MKANIVSVLAATQQRTNGSPASITITELDARPRHRQTLAMHVDLFATKTFQSAPAAVFALSLDPQRFPAAFRGYGPIPSIRRITLHAPLAVGSMRELTNSDGSRPQERITALDPPHRHAYTLTGLSVPLSWLVKAGHADWMLTAAAGGTFVEWRYRFELTTVFAWPIAWPLLTLFMTGAMRRCLTTMTTMLATDEAGG